MAKQVRGVVKHGTAAGDTLQGTAGNDTLMGYEGNDTLEGYAGADGLYGHQGDDTLFGGAGNDTLYAHEGNDSIEGGDGADSMAGGEGNDSLNGGAGNDEFLTGPGNDVLTGGANADRFFFGQPFETAMNHHTITDFDRAEGDYIDLKSIDADGDASNNPRKGNTDFTVVDGPSSVAGTAWFEPMTDPATGQQTGVSVYLNTDADPDPDMRIDVLGVTSLTWGIDIIG